MMPQWDFLDFLREEAKAFPGFQLEMEAPVSGFIEEQGRVAGVRLPDGREAARALTIAADGRSSIVRTMLPLEDLGAPMDVFWFRIAKGGTDKARLARQRRARAAARDDRPRRLLAMRLPDPEGRGGGLPGARDRGDPRGGRGGGPGRPRPGRARRDHRPPPADGEARPADLLAAAGPAGDRRCGPRHVADRRDRHQPRDPGRCRRRQYPRRPIGSAETMSIRCSTRCRNGDCSRHARSRRPRKPRRTISSAGCCRPARRSPRRR